LTCGIPYAERFVRTIKESCLDRIILVGEASLRQAVRESADIIIHHESRRKVCSLDIALGQVKRPRYCPAFPPACHSPVA